VGADYSDSNEQVISVKITNVTFVDWRLEYRNRRFSSKTALGLGILTEMVSIQGMPRNRQTPGIVEIENSGIEINVLSIVGALKRWVRAWCAIASEWFRRSVANSVDRPTRTVANSFD
jgi:hypothetical protein